MPANASKSDIRRALPCVAKVLNERERICSYVASDQTLDCYREIVRAAGWKFDRFAKNAPFVDSHNYGSVGLLLGNVRAWRVEGKSLVEEVQYVPEGASPLADFAWKMTASGFLRAVSVGFIPSRVRSRWRDAKDFEDACKELGLTVDEAATVNCIHWEQDQTELSAVLIGANPSAVAKAHQAGALVDEDFHKLGMDDDELAFIHDAAAKYDQATPDVQLSIRRVLRGIMSPGDSKLSANPHEQPHGNSAQRAAAEGNEKRAAFVRSLTATLRALPGTAGAARS
jgi:hypothetical protein